MERISKNRDGSQKVGIPSTETGKQESLKQKKQAFENMVKEYLESNPIIKNNYRQNELEIRFGTNKKLSKSLSKIDYDNVVKKLYSCGFKPEIDNGIQILRVIPESIDTKTGKSKMQIRAEIVGSDLIQEYCRTNSIQSVMNMPSTLFNKIKFTKKMTAITKTGEFIQKVDMDDYNFRVSYQIEQDYHTQTDVAKNIISKWLDSKKIFRLMNRTRFYHPDIPIFADLSIVKSSVSTRNYIPIPQYSIQDAGVLNNMECYEIELEIDNSKVGTGSQYNTTNALMNILRKCIRLVLSGLQGTPYPVSYQEQSDILQEYLAIIYGDFVNENKDDKDDKQEKSEKAEKTNKEILEERKKNPRDVNTFDFIGPSSYTLQLNNIITVNDKYNIPNIREHFTVTDKADGERKLLYVSENGNIYFIDTNMNVIFTGTKTSEKTLFFSIIDGEHIKNDKNGKNINLYAAFDIYFVNKKSIREYLFYPENEDDDTNKFRLPLLKQFIELLKPISIFEDIESSEVKPKNPKHSTDFIIKCKNFKATSNFKTIFEGCSEILSNIKDGTYEYITDGLIFTPSNLAVGSEKIGGAPGNLSKITWSHSFKWKPPEFNTIDFLVTVKKDKSGKHEVHNIFQDGMNLQGVQEVLSYKTLVLHVGFNPRKDGYINPFQDVIDDNIEKIKDEYEKGNQKYKPVPFVPTNPYDPNACFTNIMLKNESSNILMLTEEGDYFEEDMIVEFKYVIENAYGWRWIPIRVRYDKTAQLRSKKNNFGNAYKVANNNWNSIHHPVTEHMISTGENIPETIMDEDIYYNKSDEKTSTQSLRDFHNLFVKKNLIQGVSKRGDSLIDFAVGKAGDLSKWIRSNLSFVFGIDYSRDNIMNQMDGACARYLNEARKSQYIPKAIFVQGDSGLNIRNGKAFSTEKDKQIAKAVFGQGAKDITQLGKGVYNQYGIGETGFNIGSCQFALHYFFKNSHTFHHFLENIAECIKIGGYFVGTCYDGQTVFNLLKTAKKDDGFSILKNDKKIYEVIKKYDQTGFPDDEISLGYAIHVYQESINQYIQEYLVNFVYLTRIMEDYGFILITKNEANHMRLPDSNGMFSELFYALESEVKINPSRRSNYREALNMSPEERRISFMNRYFVFKKVRSVDTKKIKQLILKEDKIMDENLEESMKDIGKIIGEFESQEELIIKKKRRLVLNKPEPKKKLVLKVREPENIQVEPIKPILTGKKIILKKK
jgi:hypothetical protein